ncbi:MAG: hypothetical protein M1371_09450 [Actinobacteria bacterium]|nr:hypothetical protein [Actinomycetota bacterium]
MKNIRKYLVISIILLSIGLLGIIISGSIFYFEYGQGIGSCLTSYGTGQGYTFGLNDMMNMMSSNRFSNEKLSQKSFSFQEVKDLSEKYLTSYGLKNLKIEEIMEFSNNFYIEVAEEETGIGAVELLLDKSNGYIFPEYGPNMMWNLKYGMHRRLDLSQKDISMPVDGDKAIEIASRYLEKTNSGEYAGDEAEKYYGYYTIHTVTKDGQISGMLSVNGYTGQVWYHTWHGVFIDMKEY